VSDGGTFVLAFLLLIVLCDTQWWTMSDEKEMTTYERDFQNRARSDPEHMEQLCNCASRW
jgi:hypothetical protein